MIKYCKVNETLGKGEKPPVLSGEELIAVLEKAHHPSPMEFRDEPKIRAIAQAQRDADLPYIQQARQETAALFETIEAMYPELREVYWRGKDWQSLKSKY